ncbi:tetratricopeptide repeat protein [Magnetospirillum moscoviense]|uniref:tetratricopeptide repeat protein n=1 Tax=Magnetospirillum moscoviense TaxID=1437059 RepID=UPI000AC6D204|nr:tetratricopeptide repeat protein [Magnetospirillum moscoviense]
MTKPTRASIQLEAGRALADGARAWSDGDVDAAVSGFSRAALLNPGMPLAHMNLGVALRRQGKVAAALASYRRALALGGADPALHSNMGNALREAGELIEAEGFLRQAAAAQPENASFAYNLALLLRDRRQHAEARAILAKLAADHPDSGDYAWDLALSDLYLQDYEAGFAGYEARWRLARSPERKFEGTRWLPGADITGKTVLVTAEQGFGDALQFARFLPVLAGKGARLVVECQPELLDLFGAIAGVNAVVPKGAPPPPYDLWTPIMSLAWLLGTTMQTIPVQLPYLRPPRALTSHLGRPPGTVLNVGLIWAGKTTPRDRSWPFDKLMPLLSDPRVAVWSLQMGERAADLATHGASALVRDLAPLIGSFGDTAALMAELDLIITIDTSAAHLAGALGKPVWMLLRYVSDWRWLDEGEGSAWYPTMRMFRQADPFDFEGPVARMAEMLKAVADKRAGPPKAPA